jgi:hypothetical protein
LLALLGHRIFGRCASVACSLTIRSCSWSRALSPHRVLLSVLTSATPRNMPVTPASQAVHSLHSCSYRLSAFASDHRELTEQLSRFLRDSHTAQPELNSAQAASNSLIIGV